MKAELIWYILSHIYLAKNSDGQWSFWKLESTTGQLDCLAEEFVFRRLCPGTKSSTLEIGATQLRCLFQKSRQYHRPRSQSDVSTEALRYCFRAGPKGILPGVNIYSRSQDFNEN